MNEEELEKEFEALAVRSKNFVNSADEGIKSMVVYPRSLSIIWAFEKINEQQKEIEKLKIGTGAIESLLDKMESLEYE